jgi:hypothetical protein
MERVTAISWNRNAREENAAYAVTSSKGTAKVQNEPNPDLFQKHLIELSYPGKTA